MSKSKSEAPPPVPVPPRGGSKPPIPPPPRLSPADIKKVESWAARYGGAPIRKFR
jgi:hypothetical protein